MSRTSINPLAPFITSALVCFVGGTAHASVSVGQQAPNFTLTDLSGKKVSLADFKGKTVVLEWHNPECPFVKKHYDSKNMQNLQAKYSNADTVWLSINSTNAKHADYRPGKALLDYGKTAGAKTNAYLLDTDGKVGNTYSAKTTPHMFVIDPAGNVAYNGAIDDKRSANLADITGAKNYVATALDELKAGKPVTTTSSAPYGCSVKYAS